MTEAEALKEAAGALRLFETMAGLSATSAAPAAATHWREAAEIIERLAVRLTRTTGEAEMSTREVVTKLERCAGSDERFATLERDEVVALLNERTALLVKVRDGFTQADLDFFAANADDYFRMYCEAQWRIKDALVALNDGEQWCTERVVRALAALAAPPSPEQEQQ